VSAEAQRDIAPRFARLVSGNLVGRWNRWADGYSYGQFARLSRALQSHPGAANVKFSAMSLTFFPADAVLARVATALSCSQPMGLNFEFKLNGKRCFVWKTFRRTRPRSNSPCMRTHRL